METGLPFSEFNWLPLAGGLAGGLALFLFGMEIMSHALKQIAGNYLRTLLARMTANRFSGLAAGTLMTAIIQSSSVTTVLLVGFVSAGLMTAPQSAAVILGANIGTTVTAQILAFKVTALSLPLVAAGFLVSFAASGEVVRQAGRIVLGLGLVFLGMNVMSEAMEPLRDYPPFAGFMASLTNTLAAALAGAAFTAVVQSSSATTGILIVMAGQGLVSLETSIAIVIGANVGTCVTALLSAIGRPAEAWRVAMTHTFFNLAGALLWLGFVDDLARVTQAISPVMPDLQGNARSAAEVPRQIANAHTLFNVANAVLFIGMTGPVSRFFERLMPERELVPVGEAAPRFLDRQLLSTPDLALDAARREIVRLGAMTSRLLSRAMPLVLSGSMAQLHQAADADRDIDVLHREIVGYLRQVSLGRISSAQSDQLVGLIRIGNDLEHIADQVATEIVTSTRKRIEENVTITEMTARALADLHARVVSALDRALATLENGGAADAPDDDGGEEGLAELIEGLAEHELRRLQADEPRRLNTYAREIELIEILNDILATIRRIGAMERRYSAQRPRS